MTSEQVQDALQEARFSCGRMISSSKSLYDKTHIAVWNANILTKTHGKVWYGDLDLTTEGARLKAVAETIGEPLYVLRESSCRFETENDPWAVHEQAAVWNTTQDIPKCS